MFEFKLLDTFYDVDITLEYPDYRHTYYHSREHLIAHYKKEEDIYVFQLEERENILLNNERPAEIMDILMIEIGSSIYPVWINVSPKGKILKIRNFEKLKSRWIQKTNELLERHYTQPLSKYIGIASRNMKTEPKFRKALVRNSFVKLILKPLDAESFLFSFNDFPAKGMIAVFLCIRKRHYKDSGIVLEYKAKLISSPEYEGDGYVKYTFSELKDIKKVDARFDLTDQNGQKSVKYISIKTDKQERTVSHKKSFWSRMLE